MVRDAELHAAEDKQKRAQTEARNAAEALAFSAERNLADLGSKVSPEDRATAENSIHDLRTALKGTSPSSIDTRAAELASTMSRIGAAAYAATSGASSEAAPAGPGPRSSGFARPGAGPAAQGPSQPSDDQTVEGDFREI